MWVKRGLGAAAGVAVGLGGVEAVFENIEVKRAQIFRAKSHDVFHGKVKGVRGHKSPARRSCNWRAKIMA